MKKQNKQFEDIKQTESKLRKDNIQCENEANKTHYNIGKKSTKKKK